MVSSYRQSTSVTKAVGAPSFRSGERMCGNSIKGSLLAFHFLSLLPSATHLHFPCTPHHRWTGSSPSYHFFTPFFTSLSNFFPAHFIVLVMFSKSLFTSVLVLALSASQAYAHAAVAPALGVAGTPARSDVQRPSTAKECGKIDPATTIDTSTPIAAAADGTVSAVITNFNAYVGLFTTTLPNRIIFGKVHLHFTNL